MLLTEKPPHLFHEHEQERDSPIIYVRMSSSVRGAGVTGARLGDIRRLSGRPGHGAA